MKIQPLRDVKSQPKQIVFKNNQVVGFHNDDRSLISNSITVKFTNVVFADKTIHDFEGNLINKLFY